MIVIFRYVNIFLKLLKAVNMVGSGNVLVVETSVCTGMHCLQVRIHHHHHDDDDDDDDDHHHHHHHHCNHHHQFLVTDLCSACVMQKPFL